MKILLDTNFILTCVKQKIDFISLADELIDELVEWIVPYEVIDELKEISGKKGGRVMDRESARIGLELLKKIKVRKVKLNNKNVDVGIANYVNKHKIVLATLDSGLKKRVDGRVLSVKGGRSLGLV